MPNEIYNLTVFYPLFTLYILKGGERRLIPCQPNRFVLIFELPPSLRLCHLPSILDNPPLP